MVDHMNTRVLCCPFSLFLCVVAPVHKIEHPMVQFFDLTHLAQQQPHSGQPSMLAAKASPSFQKHPSITTAWLLTKNDHVLIGKYAYLVSCNQLYIEKVEQGWCSLHGVHMRFQFEGARRDGNVHTAAYLVKSA